MIDLRRLAHPAFLMSPPFFVDTEAANNVFMAREGEAEREVDRPRAVRQWLELYGFLAGSAMVYLLPSYSGLQDQPYVANLGAFLPHLAEPTYAISNFRSPPRRGEAEVGARFVEAFGLGRVLVAPPYFEGEADCRYLRENVYFVPYGMRTSAAAIGWLSDELDAAVVPIRLRNLEAYHLDCVLTPVTRERVAAVTGELEPAELRAVEAVAEVVPAPADILATGPTNFLRVRRCLLYGSSIGRLRRTDPDYGAESALATWMERLAAGSSMEPVAFDLSEFSKSGAALSCLVMHLNYFDFRRGE